LSVIGAHAPGHLPKDQHKQQEEDAGYLEHEDSADPAKRTNKAAQATGDVGRGFAGLASFDSLGRPNANSRSRTGGRSARVCSGAGQALPCHSPRDTKSHAQHSANGLRFHPVYDGSSDGKLQFDFGSCPYLAAALR